MLSSDNFFLQKTTSNLSEITTISSLINCFKSSLQRCVLMYLFIFSNFVEFFKSQNNNVLTSSELMILGLLSMITVIAKESKLLEHKIGKEKFDPLLYEFVHLCIFVFSIVYILLTVFVLFALIQVMFRYWAKIDVKSLGKISCFFQSTHQQTSSKESLTTFLPDDKTSFRS